MKVKSWASIIGFYFFALFMGTIFGGIGLGITQSSSEIIQNIIPSALQFSGFFLASGLYITKYHPDLLSYDSLSAKDVKFIIGTVVILFTLLAIMSAIITYLSIEPPENVVEEIASAGTISVIGLVLLNIFFVGPAEELVFRGIIQERIQQLSNPVIGISIASVLFSVTHVFSITAETTLAFTFYLVFLIIVGGVLGYAYYKTRNLFVPIIGHTVYNSVLLLQFL